MALLQALTQCQENSRSHDKLINNLKQVTVDKDELIGYVKHALVICKKETAVERMLEFVAIFITRTDDVDDPMTSADLTDAPTLPPSLSLQESVINFLLDNHDVCDGGVRMRCCQLISLILANLSEDAEVDDVLFRCINTCMLKRLRDKLPAVRVQAVLALCRLQTPTDPHCPVVKAYLYLLARDQVAEVRKAILQSISPSKLTLPAMLQRTRDVCDSVRKLAYTVLATKIHIKSLTIAQRVSLLDLGLNDHTDSVKQTCSSKLLQAWLRVYNGNIIDLLVSLDVESSQTTSQQAVKTVLKQAKTSQLLKDFDLLNDSCVIDVAKLTSENVFYWRMVCEHVTGLGQAYQHHLDTLLPTISVFYKYVKQYITEVCVASDDINTSMTQEFIIEQLFKLSTLLDFSVDEMGRRQWLEYLVELLISDTRLRLIEYITPVLNLLYKNNQQGYINKIAEIVSEIKQPLTVENVVELEAGPRRQIELKTRGQL